MSNRADPLGEHATRRARRHDVPDAVEAALDAVGDRWIFLILRECFFGARRFVDFQRGTGISRTVLSDRLTRLESGQILRRRRYTSHPPRDEYLLTDKGHDLYALTVALMRWGARWELPNAPLTLHHRGCGGDVEQLLRCAGCGTALTARDVGYQYENGTE